MASQHSVRLTKKAPSKIRDAFMKRVRNAILRMADEASEEILIAALASGSDIGALALVISNPSLEDPALEIDPLAPARARALQHRKEIAEKAGALLSTGEAADILGISRQAVDKRRKAASILAVRVGKGWKYPKLQFRNGQPLPRLRDVLRAYHGVEGWVILDSMSAEASAYGNRSIIALLEQSDNRMLDRAILEIEEHYAP
ncbi:helix-turn-helix domain-containing protein [Pontibaca salina]|uniref:Helix-turn-helix domain-containing protein n=1 Tax=Pontibaca salina TaxID=2795731 RepID=A0A934M1L5_9RHOB|nr:helix-turn-helix domain-containing protein [Pontibaca salina]MBI6630928.1 helix-turn-helix domain-containing protein [Pontibaca salina]